MDTAIIDKRTSNYLNFSDLKENEYFQRDCVKDSIFVKTQLTFFDFNDKSNVRTTANAIDITSSVHDSRSKFYMFHGSEKVIKIEELHFTIVR